MAKPIYPDSDKKTILREIIAVLFLGVVTPSVDAAYIFLNPDGFWLESFTWDMLNLLARSSQVAIPLFFIMYRSEKPWHFFGIHRPKLLYDFLTGFLLWIAKFFLWCLITLILYAYLVNSPSTFQFIKPERTSDYLLLFIAILSNSIAEECLIRGYLISRLKQYGLSSNLAILLTASLWAIYHIYQGIYSTIIIWFGGLLYGYAFVRIRRILPLIIAHTLWNLFVYLV